MRFLPIKAKKAKLILQQENLKNETISHQQFVQKQVDE
jgi:hypothetical protein